MRPTPWAASYAALIAFCLSTLQISHAAAANRYIRASQLGILELIVRFEGGPSCSVLITLQGRAFGTDAFCTMDSIEAAPTPPLRPVVEALVEELRRRP